MLKSMYWAPAVGQKQISGLWIQYLTSESAFYWEQDVLRKEECSANRRYSVHPCYNPPSCHYWCIKLDRENARTKLVFFWVVNQHQSFSAITEFQTLRIFTQSLNWFRYLYFLKYGLWLSKLVFFFNKNQTSKQEINKQTKKQHNVDGVCV